MKTLPKVLRFHKHMEEMMKQELGLISSVYIVCIELWALKHGLRKRRTSEKFKQRRCGCTERCCLLNGVISEQTPVYCMS